MEDDDGEPPLAVEITKTINCEPSQPSDQSNQRCEIVEAAPVGVTVITGYLGAGKSTVMIGRYIDTDADVFYKCICIHTYLYFFSWSIMC